jgi:hypothetical protein
MKSHQASKPIATEDQALIESLPLEALHQILFNLLSNDIIHAKKTPGFEAAIIDLMQLDKTLRKRKLPHTWSLLKICTAYLQQDPPHPANPMLRIIKSKLYNLAGLTSRCLYEFLATSNQPIRERIYHKQVSLPEELVNSLIALEKTGLTF